MEWLSNNIGLVCSIAGVLITGLSVLYSLITKGKKSKVLTGLAKVVNSFPTAIQMAEKIGGTGEEKKTFVMGQAKLLCQAMGFEPTEGHLAEFSAIVDNLVALSKSININSKTGAKTVSEELPLAITPLNTLITEGENNVN